MLFINAKGEVLGEVNNYGTPVEFLQAMLQVLKAHPEYDQPSSADESASSALERAEIRIDLQDYPGAAAILEQEDSAAGHYLLGRLARLQGNWNKMEAHLQRVDDKSLASEVRMERAYCLWFNKEYDPLRGHLKDFPKSSNRYTEARYYEGVALYHLGKKDEALAVWKETIEGGEQDPWIYRADWGYSNVLDGNKTAFSSAEIGSSLLHRIGYIGRQNPDLRGPMAFAESAGEQGNEGVVPSSASLRGVCGLVVGGVILGGFGIWYTRRRRLKPMTEAPRGYR